jgi:hypothetical protein
MRLGLFIRVIMSITYGAGGLAIDPHLSCRWAVPADSAAFKLLTDTQKSLFLSINWGLGDSETTIRKTIHKLSKLFDDGGASPTDTLPSGSTLLEVSFLGF